MSGNQCRVCDILAVCVVKCIFILKSKLRVITNQCRMRDNMDACMSVCVSHGECFVKSFPLEILGLLVFGTLHGCARCLGQYLDVLVCVEHYMMCLFVWDIIWMCLFVWVGAIWPSLSPCTVINPILLTCLFGTLYRCACLCGTLYDVLVCLGHYMDVLVCLGRCDMAFIEPMHCNKPNITYLFVWDII